MSGCLSENTIAQVLDGRLPPEERPRIDRHIDECKGCRALLASLAGAAPQPPAATEDPWIGRWIGNYRLVRPLGAGGMGAVYEAVYPRIGRQAAIKVLRARFARDPALVARFLNEGRAANHARHPSIVDVFEVGALPDGTAYMVMEYLDGETLDVRLRRAGRLGGPAAVRLGRQVASALAAAHEQHIVHRDLKPANVMLVPDPEATGGERAKVLDFGIAKVPSTATGDDDGEPGVHTGSDVVMGTPLYMAPEQCRGAGGVTAQADVYALGVMLYQMLTGAPPFVGAGAGEIIAHHLRTAPRALREVDPAVAPDLAALVHAMLSKEPAERPSMGEVAARLESMDRTRDTGPLPLPHRPARRPPPGAPPTRWRGLLGVALLTIAVGGLVVAWGLRAQPRAPTPVPLPAQAPAPPRLQAAPAPRPAPAPAGKRRPQRQMRNEDVPILGP